MIIAQMGWSYIDTTTQLITEMYSFDGPLLCVPKKDRSNDGIDYLYNYKLED